MKRIKKWTHLQSFDFVRRKLADAVKEPYFRYVETIKR